MLGGEHASTPQSRGGGSSPVETEPPQIVFVVVVLETVKDVCMITAPYELPAN